MFHLAPHIDGARQHPAAVVDWLRAVCHDRDILWVYVRYAGEFECQVSAWHADHEGLSLLVFPHVDNRQPVGELYCPNRAPDCRIHCDVHADSNEYTDISWDKLQEIIGHSSGQLPLR